MLTSNSYFAVAMAKDRQSEHIQAAEDRRHARLARLAKSAELKGNLHTRRVRLVVTSACVALVLGAAVGVTAAGVDSDETSSNSNLAPAAF